MGPVALQRSIEEPLTLSSISPNAAEPLTVTVDQAYLLRLQRDADVVMIANPRIADVVVESARMIFVLGLQPGETNL